MNLNRDLKNYANPDRWACYSIAVNVGLIGLDSLVAVASGSLAVGAEVVHNGVDLLSAIGVLVGIKLAVHKSKRFPYGLYKLENMIAVVIAMLIFLTAYGIAHQAIFGNHSETTPSWWMFAALTVATAVPAIFSYFELKVGRAAKSPALIADAKEYQVHVLTTGVALAALTGEYFRLQVDRFAALLIVIPVLKTGWELLYEGTRVLLDASLDQKTLNAIRDVVVSEPMVVEVGAVTGRNAGRFRFVEITAVLRGNNLEKADQAAHRMEKRIRGRLPNVERVQIHVDPNQSDRLHCAVPLADRQGTVAGHFSAAPFFAIVTVNSSDGKLEPARIMENPHRWVKQAKGIRTAEWLVKQKIDIAVLPTGMDEKGPLYVFGDAAVTIHRSDAPMLSEAIAEVTP
ncbi:MAG: cation diffusion facilitator family transporter [Pirellulales bacterium]|nr:cation diffusion facilitator family transporter [Pirellulales bacterium]